MIKSTLILFILLTGFENLWAQSVPVKDKTRLFDSGDLLDIRLDGNLKELLNNETSDKKYPSTLSFKNKAGNTTEIPVEIKTRGHFRRQQGICNYPPIRIDFEKKGKQAQTLFHSQKKLKLVMPCKDDDYVVREWLVYQLYNLLSPFSYRARLVRVQLTDAALKKPIEPMYGILLEEEKQLAKRTKTKVLTQKLKPINADEEIFLKMAVFEYLIGNTDWSVEYQHNINLLGSSERRFPITVAYDFDHSGMVNAPYALPAEALLLESVKTRRYRGYCLSDTKKFEPVLAYFNELKENIYDLYKNCAYLEEKSKKYSLQYLDDFYKTINSPKIWNREFGYPCDKMGTGNVVIQGLK